MGIFTTQANTQFNSFQNPLPTLNMSGPGWGIDQTYLTPSYAAPYRPGYQEAPITSARPGFFESFNNQINPFAADGYGKWQNPFLQQQQYREQFVPRAVDAGVWTAQNIGVGAAAFWLGGGAVTGAAKMAGYKSAWGMGASWGSSLFGGTARGLMGPGLAASNIGGAYGIAGGAAFAGRIAGGLFGGMILPLAASQAIVNAADSAIFDPYVNTKRTARDLRENFSGITYGGDSGNPYTGKGLSFAQSSRTAGDITRAGFKEFSLTGKDITSISDLASRAGLLENVRPGEFAKQITAITKQVAIIAAVANDPDFRNSIEVMAKLKDAGLNPTSAGSFMSKFASHASVAGISTKRMMELGVQGQFLFGANNITPYLGLEQYAQSYSSFAAAHRQGLVSPALLARMGGVEGATQSSLTGMVNAAQTPYNQVLMANQYLSGMGGSTGNVVGNLSRFGQSVARDPFAMMGGMGYHSGAMMSAQMKDRGILGLQDQIMDIARKIPGMLNEDGTLNEEKAYLIAKNVMGLDHAQAEASVVQLRNARSSGFVGAMSAGARSQYISAVSTMMDAEGLSGWKPVVIAKSSVKKGWASVKTTMHDSLVAPVIGAEARVADSLGLAMDELKYGQFRPGEDTVDINDVAGTKGNVQTNEFKLSRRGERFLNYQSDNRKRGAKNLIDILNVMSSKGDREADAILNAPTKEKLRARIKALAEKNPAIRTQLDSGGGSYDVVEDLFFNQKYGGVEDKLVYLNATSSAIGDYHNRLEKAGLGVTDLKAAANYKGDSVADPTGSRASAKVRKALESRDEKAFSSQLNSLDAEYSKRKKDGETMDQYVKRVYGGLQAAIVAQGGDVSISAISGNDRVDYGTEESHEKFKKIGQGLREHEAGIRKLHKEGKITGSTYLTEINKLSGERISNAAELMHKTANIMHEAGLNMLAASGKKARPSTANSATSPAPATEGNRGAGNTPGNNSPPPSILELTMNGLFP